MASLHVGRFRLRRSVSRLISLAAERWEIANWPGCRLGKVMGSGSEGTTTTSVDLRRWLIFAAWDNPDCLARFEHDSETLNRWQSQALQIERYDLRPLSSRGSWSGLDPFANAQQHGQQQSPEAKIAVLTRASVRWHKVPTFTAAIPRVDRALQESPGCELAMGIGEWPIGQQATFSVWDSAEAMANFAHNGPTHSEVVKRTYAEGWYSEEMFSRFEVTGHHQL